MSDVDMDNEGELDDISSESDSEDSVLEDSEVHRLEGSDLGDVEPLQTSFDRYFSFAGKKMQSSTNVFSRIVPPIDRDDFSKVLQKMPKTSSTEEGRDKLESDARALFPNYLLELTMGYNLMFYGVGSKRVLLNDLAKFCAKSGHVMIANGFLSDFSLKSFFSKIDAGLQITSPPLDGPQPEAHCQRVCEFFKKGTPRRLFLIIHNIDVIGIRNPRARKCVQILNSCPRIHIVASMDNIMAAMMWANTVPLLNTNDLCPRSLSWLWHELTTFRSYDVELAGTDRTSFSGAHIAHKLSRQQGGTTSQGSAITETAAHHVLASVTDKAKKLFLLLGRAQIEAMADSTLSQNGPQNAAMSYDMLFRSARDEFIATNDTALRALLSEFRDHAMVVSASAAEGGEALWIPMSREGLGRILQTIEQ